MFSCSRRPEALCDEYLLQICNTLKNNKHYVIVYYVMVSQINNNNRSNFETYKLNS